MKVSKLIFVVVDIEYFDSTFLCDIQEFDLHHESASFCQHLQNIRINYREEKLFSLLLECFRDFALFWYQKQNEIVKQNLNEWLKILIIAFFAKSFANFSFSKFDIFVSSVSSSSQYHFCLNCFAFFFSLTRLLQHTQIVCQKVVCKQCEEVFKSKNKFHEHIRQHHTKKIVKTMKSRFNRERNKSLTISSTISQTISTISFKTTTTKFSIFRFVTFSERSRNSSISFVIFATIASTTSKRSHFSLFTLKFTSKFARIALISLFISFATFSSKLRKSISKFYFTIDDLIRMFVEKFKSFDLQQHQNRRFSSQNSDVRRFVYQSRIIVYFLFAINQKISISQNLKNSNSKNFQQHTFAKSISLCRFVSVLSKKSIFSSYKKSNFFYISLQSRFSFLQSRFSSRFSFAWFRFIFSFTFSSFFRFSFSNFHVCCICFDRFNFRNNSFDYSWFNHRYFSNRRSLRKIWKK